VVQQLNFVHFHKDVNQNLVNVLKEDVVNYGDHVLMVNVVVKTVTVVLLQNSVLVHKDANQSTENVRKVDVAKNGEHV